MDNVWEKGLRKAYLVSHRGFVSFSKQYLKGDGAAVELIREQKLDNVLWKEGYPDNECSTMETALDFYDTIIQLKEIFSSVL